MWREGIIGVPTKDGKVSIRYCIKHFEEGSQFGIGGGRISKLELRQDGKCICNYDRGWDIKATTPEARFALRILLHDYN